MGMTKSHRANPLASLRAECIFAAPVLYSGIASLLLYKSESDILSSHVKETFSKLLKLHPKTPSPVNLLTLEKQSNKNWFSEIRSLCFTYNLPHPLLLLRYPPSKEDFKYRVKTNITDFWQTKLRQHSKELEDKCLKYFKPNFMSLSKPHPLYAIIRARIHQLPSK